MLASMSRLYLLDLDTDLSDVLPVPLILIRSDSLLVVAPGENKRQTYSLTSSSENTLESTRGLISLASTARFWKLSVCCPVHHV